MVSVTTLSVPLMKMGNVTLIQPPGRLAVDWSTKLVAEVGQEKRMVLPAEGWARTDGPLTTPRTAPGVIATLSINTAWSPVAVCAKVSSAALLAAVIASHLT